MSDIIKLGIRNAMLTLLDPESKEPGILFRNVPPQKQEHKLSDEDLIFKAEDLLHHLLLTEVLSVAMLGPAISNNDLSFIFTELIRRFKNLKEEMSHVDTDPRNSY